MKAEDAALLIGAVLLTNLVLLAYDRKAMKSAIAGWRLTLKSEFQTCIYVCGKWQPTD
jgi:hypothetical protein